MADYWIKLYHEIIDDPKMATLPDRLWRRAIEIFLLAGKLCNDKSGLLPDTKQLAWLLRMSTDELQMDLQQLASTGIIQAAPNGWLVVNFAKRQKAATGAERVSQYRNRKQKQEYYDDVTQVKRNVTQINRAETETETETEQTRARSENSSTDDHRESTKEALSRGMEKHKDDFEHGIDLVGFPEELHEIIRETCNLWGFRTPTQKGRRAKWIDDARLLKAACGEFGIEPVRRERQRVIDYMSEHKGISPYTYKDLGSLTGPIEGMAAQMRTEGDLPTRKSGNRATCQIILPDGTIAEATV